MCNQYEYNYTLDEAYTLYCGGKDKICAISLISATHGHVPVDEKIDADSLFVDVKNDIEHTTRTIDNALQVYIYIYMFLP